MTDFERALLEEKDKQIQDYKNLFLAADKERELLQQELDRLKEKLKNRDDVPKKFIPIPKNETVFRDHREDHVIGDFVRDGEQE